MFKPVLRSCICAGLLAVALAGCDTQEGEGTQGGDSLSSETGAEEFSGFVDRTFAGEEMANVEVVDPGGTTLSLKNVRGEPVLLNLWATWCAPCIVEMPLLDELASSTKGQLRVLTVSADIEGAAKVVPFFAANNLSNLPQWMDPENNLAFSFGGGVLPLTILYDKDGKEVWRVIGGFDWSSEEASDLVAEAMEAA